MSNYIGDLSNYYGLVSTYAAGGSTAAGKTAESNNGLDMTDFLALMVAQFQNQSIDSTADTSDMLNQLVQMSVVQAISEISEAVGNMTDASVMTYASSLVGKEVTLGLYNDKGVLEEHVGTVTGTGVSGGQQVIFVNGESYYLSDILAVGRLPESD